MLTDEDYLNMMTNDEIIEVVLAHKRGRRIQFRNERWDWTDCANNQPSWEFSSTDYRVAPELPNPREWWIHPSDVEYEKDRILTKEPANPSWIP